MVAKICSSYVPDVVKLEKEPLHFTTLDSVIWAMFTNSKMPFGRIKTIELTQVVSVEENESFGVIVNSIEVSTGTFETEAGTVTKPLSPEGVLPLELMTILCTTPSDCESSAYLTSYHSLD